MKKIEGEFFQVMLRKRNDDFLFCNKHLARNFVHIKPKIGYWAADPFLLKIKDKNILFVEMCSYFTGNGYIAYTFLNNNLKKIKWQTLIKNKNHFSFPFVLKEDERIYIIPESCQQLSVIQYEMDQESFNCAPFKILLNNIKTVDSVLFTFKGIKYLLSYQLNKNINCLNLYRVNMNETLLIDSVPDNNNALRPAGKIFVYKDNIIFPSQKNTSSYGDDIIFNIINISSKKIEIIDILDFSISSLLDKKYNGCHTYNFNEDYEVIDVRIIKFSFLRIIGKIYRLARNTRKIHPINEVNKIR